MIYRTPKKKITQKKEAFPDTLKNNAKDSSWQEERLLQETQRRAYKRYAFYGAAIICIILYMLFFIAMALLIRSTIALQIFIAHKHLMGIWIALLVVPSALLWGLVRAVYNVNPSQNAQDTMKAMSSIHPLN